MFWVGYCREKTGQAFAAINQYKAVIEQYPQTQAADEAQDRLSRLTAQPTTLPR